MKEQLGPRLLDHCCQLRMVSGAELKKQKQKNAHYFHTTACVRLDGTGLDGSLVRTPLRGFIETKNLRVAAH